jgi:hypothetical protein
MLYWIYELPTVAVVGIFAALFVAICWVATILSRPIVQARIHRPSGLKDCHVCFGSLADIVTSPRHVRFTPNNGRWMAHPSQHLAVGL